MHELGAQGSHCEYALLAFIITTSLVGKALTTREPVALLASAESSAALEESNEVGTREPLREKQLVPLLQPTMTGAVKSTIKENVISFFILVPQSADICRIMGFCSVLQSAGEALEKAGFANIVFLQRGACENAVFYKR